MNFLVKIKQSVLDDRNSVYLNTSFLELISIYTTFYMNITVESYQISSQINRC